MSLIPYIQGVYFMVPISAAAVMECRLSAKKCSVQKGTVKEKIYRSATNIFTKISDFGGTSPRKIRSTRGKL